MADEINSYHLSRNWFDWCFENPEKVSPNHSAIYFFAIEHCNRLGWKKKFGFPTQMAMDAIGIKKHDTYIRYFNDLVEWGFFDLVEKSRNQYSSNIISLVCAVPKNGKALGKAIQKHAGKQTQSNGESNGSIDKPITLKPITGIADKSASIELRQQEFYKSLTPYVDIYGKEMVRAFYEYWIERSPNSKKMRFEKEDSYDLNLRLKRWAKRGNIEPQVKKTDFSYAENMKDMKKDEWEKLFRGQLETNNEFRKHFGYEEL